MDTPGDAAAYYRSFRLPSGKHKFSAEFVAESQRWRLLGATAAIVAERGIRRLNVDAIVSTAAVSKRTFYNHFENLDGCLLATYRVAAGCLAEAGSPRPDAALAPRLAAICEQLRSSLDEEPELARMLAPDTAIVATEVAAARQELIAAMAERHGKAALAAQRRLATAAVLSFAFDPALATHAGLGSDLSAEIAAICAAAPACASPRALG